ncbi:MAG: hydrogenase expression/formation protein [Nitrospirae bacterium]|nr:hydrogenase expression/formation protein [Nitrospirota bacterium]MBI5694325.1 AIR synthase family protein [Nitrospirota bacterium]
MEGAFPTGKLPPGVLGRLLKDYARPGRGVVVGPGIGMDAAVLDIGAWGARGNEPGGAAGAGCPASDYLVAKTDPITFVSEDIGAYAITINANDVACTGGTPRWFTMAVILPEGGADEALVESIFRSASETCDSLGISLVGGHTEITHGLDRPIVVGHMLGTVPRDRVITTSGARPGDTIILTKGIAIEAVSIIAREKAGELSEHYHEDFIQQCRDYVTKPGISVSKDARIALAAGDVHCMHDPTEGGLSSGLYEIAEAAGVGLEVRAKDIRVLPEAFELLRRYRLDPLGSIASGALVITAPPSDAERIIAALDAEDINAYDIGVVTDKADGVKLVKASGTVDLPVFARDEITRLFCRD